MSNTSKTTGIRINRIMRRGHDDYINRRIWRGPMAYIWLSRRMSSRHLKTRVQVGAGRDTFSPSGRKRVHYGLLLFGDLYFGFGKGLDSFLTYKW